MSLSVKLKSQWDQLAEKFSALQMREKLLIAISLLLILYLVWDLVIASDLKKKRDKLVSRFESANKELLVLSAQEQVFVKSLSNDPNAAKRREVLRLEKQLAQANEELQQMSAGLLSARQLPQVLHDVLLESNRLQLVGMQSIPPSKLQLSTDQPVEVLDETDEAVALAEEENRQPVSNVDKARLEEERIVGVYKHAVRITLKGQYFAVVDYLERLENLQWKLYWNFIEYEVGTYPNAEVTLEVYTLSTDKGVLGV